MVPPTFDTIEAERRHRKERLAAGFRLLAKRALTTGPAGHITVRDPELTDHFWVNPFVVPFSRMTVSDLILVNHAGDIVEGDRTINAAAFAIHSRIHSAHPTLNGACHSHSTYGRPFSATSRLIEMTSQDACSFYESQVLFTDFSGVVLAEEEGDRIAEALATPTPCREGNKLAILENHGLLTVGETVDEAVFWFLLGEKMCHDQLLLDATNKPYRVIDHDVAAATRDVVGLRFAGWLSFQTLYDEIVHEQPDLLD
ncbi:MAG: class II aldolase/adducin family protein [Acidimicrobiia bacterium]|nr:class II aldolase/adducin family protein [Acidimicrobiia bacterium]